MVVDNKTKCPLCGGRVVYQGLHEVECETPGCDNCPGEEVTPDLTEEEMRNLSYFLWGPK